MPIYRTVSDRGLWKKYQRSEQSGQPQHFHKPHYLDKEKPVVSHTLYILKYLFMLSVGMKLSEHPHFFLEFSVMREKKKLNTFSEKFLKLVCAVSVSYVTVNSVTENILLFIF